MPNIKTSLPGKLKRLPDEFKKINWSEVAREAIRKKAAGLSMLNALDKLIGQGASDEEALAIAKRLKESPDDEELAGK